MTGLETMLVSAGMSASTAATVSTVASIGSTVFGVMSSIQQANAASASADYNAAVSTRNARIAEMNAEADVAKRDRLARIRAGGNVASVGKGGGTTAGSAMDLLEDNALENALELATVRHQGTLKAQGFEQDAAIERVRGKSAKTKGFISAGSQVLLGASNRATRNTGGGLGGGFGRNMSGPYTDSQGFGVG